MPQPPVPSSGLPLDRAALERVLARAAELQAASGEPADTLTDQQILDLGKEVGISSQFLRQALAEERAANPAEREGAASLAKGVVSAERTVPGTDIQVLGALDGWLQREEWLQVKRQFPDRITWEPRRDFEGAFRRAFNIGGRGYALSRATQVGATVIPVDDRQVLVRLDADLSEARRTAFATMAGGTVSGAVVTGIAVALNVALPVAAVPVVAAAAISFIAARRVHERVVSRAQLALEQLLDRLQRGERPAEPSLLKMIATAAGALPRR